MASLRSRLSLNSRLSIKKPAHKAQVSVETRFIASQFFAIYSTYGLINTCNHIFSAGLQIPQRCPLAIINRQERKLHLLVESAGVKWE